MSSFNSQYGGSDTPYLRSFVKETAPAFLDHVAILSGAAPPARQAAFSWCDLGCGQGVTAVMLAAMHPQGEFHGIDMMPAHVDHARRLAAESATGNVAFHLADFGAALELPMPQFDYIVAHGVYSWVSPQVRGDLRSFIDRRLKPGGLVYLSYNALPGRAADLPMQRLVRAFSETIDGRGVERVSGALQVANSLRALKSASLANSPMLDRINEHVESGAIAYVAHELLAPHWEPLCVTDVRAELAGIGLEPLGTATLLENYDTLALTAPARGAIAGIADRGLRELARDFLIDQSFRRDVFARDPKRQAAEDQRRLLLASTFGLTRQPSRIAYEVTVLAGRMVLTPAARTIVEALASGPRVLDDVVQEYGIAPTDAVPSALMLCATGQMQPTEPGRATVTAFNAAVLGRLNGGEEVGYFATPFGTSILINETVRDILNENHRDERADPSWQDYLAIHGMASIP